MIKVTKANENKFTISLVTKTNKVEGIIPKKNVITEDTQNKRAYIFVEKEVSKCRLGTIAEVIMKAPREYQVDVPSFTNPPRVYEKDVVKAFYNAHLQIYPNVYSAKTKKKKVPTIRLINVSPETKEDVKKIEIIYKAREMVIDWQVTPPNILNSEVYAKEVKKTFENVKNITTKILNKKQIQELNMGLLLSVNAGSAYEPRVVILEYKGDKSTKTTTTLVGKGITFDSGGYNLKPGRHMLDMKFDMSGSAVVAGVMKVISQLKPKANVVGILCITDNKVSSYASTPDTVWTAMNGKSVEVNNTDAEGRLALADGMSYAIEKYKPTRLVTIATLTGAVVTSLGSTYSGAWATSEEGWTEIQTAAKKAREKIWRLPLHEDFFKYMSTSKRADFYNTNLSNSGGGSSSAAMFLKQFVTKETDFIHLDIAGTASTEQKGHAPLVETLFELIND